MRFNVVFCGPKGHESIAQGLPDGWNLRTALRARSAFGPDRRPWRESGRRRDAYDTVGSVTCVTLRPSEK
jgi:hypothetical protein